MADLYVRSDGSNTSPYDTWAKAATTFAAASTAASDGDTIYVDDAFTESSAGSKTYSLSTTNTTPTKVLVVDSTGDPEPPTTMSTGASINSTDGQVAFDGAGYIEGMTWKGYSAAQIGDSAQGTRYNISAVNCSMQTNRVGASSPYLGFGINDGASPGKILLKDSTIYFANITQGCYLYSGFIHWNNVSLAAGSATTPDGIFKSVGSSSRSGCRVLAENCDWSGFSTTTDLVKIIAAGDVLIRNCKLPASWAGNWTTTTYAGKGWRLVAQNVSSGDINYQNYILTDTGSIVEETTLVRTGGSSDGTTSLSWNMTTNANAEELTGTLESEEIVQWNETVGSSITVTAEILHDSVTNLQDDEIWLEVSYLGTSGFPLGVNIDDKRATVLTSAADQATSTETWTTTGMTNPNEQKLSVTFTPQEKGFIHAKVHVGKASYTVYVCPKLEIS